MALKIGLIGHVEHRTGYAPRKICVPETGVVPKQKRKNAGA